MVSGDTSGRRRGGSAAGGPGGAPHREWVLSQGGVRGRAKQRPPQRQRPESQKTQSFQDLVSTQGCTWYRLPGEDMRLRGRDVQCSGAWTIPRARVRGTKEESNAVGLVWKKLPQAVRSDAEVGG